MFSRKAFALYNPEKNPSDSSVEADADGDAFDEKSFDVVMFPFVGDLSRNFLKNNDVDCVKLPASWR